MISVEEALAIIKKNVPAPTKENVSLEKALGCVLASDVRSPLALPVHDNSAMDGFVLRASDVKQASASVVVRLKIKGDIQAGDSCQRKLMKGETYRIMTGAFIPAGGSAVLAKEDAVVVDGYLLFKNPVAHGKHIRKKGEEISKGEHALGKGSVIHPGTVGFLATLGKGLVPIYKKPRISVIATGSELVKPGTKLKHGQIYESNSWMIASALESMAMPALRVETVKDNPKHIRKAIRQALLKSDVLILMGGVSVGDYDYVKDILAEQKVRQLFWKVKQKPGKPLYVGKKGKTLVFGLPGNPASVFTCFYKYVYPALRAQAGFTAPELASEELRTEQDLGVDSKRTLLLKSRVRFEAGEKKVTVLGRQGSHMLSSLCESNAFVVVPPNEKSIRKGSRVKVDLLPFGGG